jgi:hypothetical protein
MAHRPLFWTKGASDQFLRHTKAKCQWQSIVMAPLHFSGGYFHLAPAGIGCAQRWRRALSPRAARLTLTGLYAQNSQSTALLASIKMTRSLSDLAQMSADRGCLPVLRAAGFVWAQFRPRVKLWEKATLEFEACETPLLSLGGAGNSEGLGSAMPWPSSVTVTTRAARRV